MVDVGEEGAYHRKFSIPVKFAPQTTMKNILILFYVPRNFRDIFLLKVTSGLSKIQVYLTVLHLYLLNMEYLSAGT